MNSECKNKQKSKLLFIHSTKKECFFFGDTKRFFVVIGKRPFKMEIQVDNICSLIKQLNVNDDSIVQNRKIRDICMAQDFHNVTGEDHMLK